MNKVALLVEKFTSLFNSLTNIQKVLATVIVSVIIFSGSTTLTYALSSRFASSLPTSTTATSLPGPSNALEENPSEPRTESCPLNGVMRTKKAREFWEKRRPLAVMIENHTEARPQSGLSSADVVYEAVAEGGITRFMAVYYCDLADVQIGPIRSARTYFLDWASELDSLYAHVGGANTPGPADALGQIIKYEIKSLNQFGIGFPTYWRDYQRLGHPVATEHTMYSTTQKLWEVGAKREWTATDSAGIAWDRNFTPWSFKDDQGGGTIKEVTVNFWESQSGYQVEWLYEPTINAYKRKNGGQEHANLNNKKQLEAKVIIIQFQKESRANDGYPGNVHILYGTTGTGRALIFQDGQVTEGKWVKNNRTARTRFLDSDGREVKLNKGQIWIQTVPEGAKVSY